MPLSIDERCLRQLEGKLAKALEEVRVEQNCLLQAESLNALSGLDGTLPKPHKCPDALARYVGDAPLFTFLWDSLSAELWEKQGYDQTAQVRRLMGLHPFKDVTALARRLLSQFTSLPWDYSISVELPPAFAMLLRDTFEEDSISDTLKLVVHSPKFAQTFVPPTTASPDRSCWEQVCFERWLAKEATGHTADRPVYLQILRSGFIGQYAVTAPLRSAMTVLKSFLGLAVAIHLLKIDRSANPGYRGIPLMVHGKVGTTWAFRRMHELELGQSQTFSRLTFDDLDSRRDTQQKQLACLKESLSLLKKIYACETDEAGRIIRAAQWLFDSYCGSNRLLSFVQTTIAIEILLGDKTISDQMGIGALLSNRCAYLIAKSTKERQQILDDFKEIYCLRSKIVHEGKDELSSEQEVLFEKQQRICRRVIQEELNLLPTDSPESRGH